MEGQQRGDNLYADYKMLQKFKGKELKLFRKNKVGRFMKYHILLQSNNNNGSAILAQ